MKGAVFIALNELVESRYGIQAWEDILAQVKPSCEGVYTSTESYPDSEINDYVRVISTMLDLPSSEVTRIFGRFLFDELNTKYPVFTKAEPDFFNFISSIENVIHKEVRKLYHEVSLPNLSTNRVSEDCLDLFYTSPRKLCFLSEGLVFGAAEFYGKSIEIDHKTCMHNSDDHCTLRITRHV